MATLLHAKHNQLAPNVRLLLFSTEGSAFHVGTVFLQGNKEVFVTTDGSCTAFQRRPFLKDFLEAVCPLFEVAVFTAGSRVRPPSSHAPTPCSNCIMYISVRPGCCGWELAASSSQALLALDRKHAQSVNCLIVIAFVSAGHLLG